MHTYETFVRDQAYQTCEVLVKKRRINCDIATWQFKCYWLAGLFSQATFNETSEEHKAHIYIQTARYFTVNYNSFDDCWTVTGTCHFSLCLCTLPGFAWTLNTDTGRQSIWLSIYIYTYIYMLQKESLNFWHYRLRSIRRGWTDFWRPIAVT